MTYASNDRKQALVFYSSSTMVSQYEYGRANRVYVPDLPKVLQALQAQKERIEIPLYAMFDWLYWRRLNSVGIRVLSGNILDLGCGTSYVPRSLMASGWKGAITGIDTSTAMLEEGTRRIQSLLDRGPVNEQTAGMINVYTDQLGRSVIELAPPHNIVDRQSAEFMLSNRFALDVRDLPGDQFDHIVAFSGPLCFFPLDEQARLIYHLCKIAKYGISLQFKNASFARFRNCSGNMEKAEEVISHLFSNEVQDSYSFLRSLDLKFDDADRIEPAVQHEVGNFRYQTTNIESVDNFFEQAGFTTTRCTTLGFVSENFFGIASEYFHRAASSPGKLLAFFNTLTGIDDYFCEWLRTGDNLHVSASPTRAKFLRGERDSTLRESNFRTHYSPRTI